MSITGCKRHGYSEGKNINIPRIERGQGIVPRIENLTGYSTISAYKKLQVKCFIKGGWKVNRTHTASRSREDNLKRERGRAGGREDSGLKEPKGDGRQIMDQTGATRA